MKQNQIRKVSEAQITDAAFAYGQRIATYATASIIDSRGRRDSLQKHYKVRIKVLRAGDKSMSETERQIIEAYTDGMAAASLTNNVQRIGKDSILFTHPIERLLPDGSRKFNYAIGISTSRKQIVLSIKL